MAEVLIDISRLRRIATAGERLTRIDGTERLDEGLEAWRADEWWLLAAVPRLSESSSHGTWELG